MSVSVASVVAKSVSGRDSTVRHLINRIPQPSVNIGQDERMASLAIGGGLFLSGLLGRKGCVASLLAGAALMWRGASGNCQLYRVLDINTAKGNDATVIPAQEGVRVAAAVIVNRPEHEVYAQWRDLEQLPRYMSHLREVTEQDGHHSHWVARGPLGMSLEWDAEITKDVRNEMISWRSIEGADVDTVGSVHFRPVNGGCTEVKVNLKYNPPAGRLGIAFAKAFGQDPDIQIHQDLLNFKRFMESKSPIGANSPDHARVK